MGRLDRVSLLGDQVVAVINPQTMIVLETVDQVALLDKNRAALPM
jgi:hypothetical protein